MGREPGRSPRRPSPLGTRGAVVLGLFGCGAWAFWHLDLTLASLWPHAGGREIAVQFFSRALTPAWTSEADFVPVGTPPLLWIALEAAWYTLAFAAASMGLSIVVGLTLGTIASTAWWEGGGARAPRIAPWIYGSARALIAGMRSVHELLWALLFLVAFGLTDIAAVIAITIPYGGTLAKIYSELIDEAPRDTSRAVRAAGGTRLAAYAIGALPRALPDMLAYTFYRFECALRSAAILGFFGYPTLGLYMRQSFSTSNYGEVWTFLYSLLALVLVFDAWSGALRKRLVA